MDRDTRRLVDELCTRAGMIMEDVSTLAITTRNLGDSEILAKKDALVVEARNICALLEVAHSLIR